jgi:hypothetical protein
MQADWLEEHGQAQGRPSPLILRRYAGVSGCRLEWIEGRLRWRSASGTIPGTSVRLSGRRDSGSAMDQAMPTPVESVRFKASMLTAVERSRSGYDLNER